MKKILTLTVFLLSFFLGARAQVFILNDNVFQGRMSNIKTTVLDSLTREPVPFASVYVIPAKDTTITNFTLTSDQGEATLEEVPYGNYVFHIEMMGYRPYVKERFFRQEEVDLGTILLKQDEQFLQAATITDVGNPIVVKKDTVEFNASSFRVGANAMLKDLLKRMPGMEITEDGKVKFNGEEIDKLTVGGRTFFFNDQSAALNNLPAAVVDKIRVIDRESEQTRATGIQDGNREKVLDVALKKEYEKGWFGNVGLKGGTTLGKKGDADALRDNRGLLWSGNVLASAYSEKDQLTVIANGQNINDSNVVMVMIDEDGERTRTSGQGLSTAAQLAVNANTSRIKDVETTVGANYKYTDTDTGTRSLRTTYQDDGNLISTAESGGKSYAHGLNANAEFKKENGKVQFHIRPTFRYNAQNDHNYSRLETLREGVFLNSSDNTSYGQSRNKSAMFDSDMVFRPDTLERMMAVLDEHPEIDVLSGLYFRRGQPFSPVLFKTLEVNEQGTLDWSDYEELPNELFEIAGCGFGCVLMRTDMLLDIAGKEGGGRWFTPIADAGEDCAFCIRARREGYKIYCDPTVDCGHMAYTPVTKDFWKAIRHEEGQ